MAMIAMKMKTKDEIYGINGTSAYVHHLIGAGFTIYISMTEEV